MGSNLISFRLNDNNPRERKALEYLEALNEQYRTDEKNAYRQIFADLLVAAVAEASAIDQVLEQQQQVLEILTRLEVNGIASTIEEQRQVSGVSDELKNSLLEGMKPVTMIDDSGQEV